MTINITPAFGKANLVAGQYIPVYTAPNNCLSVTVNARMLLQDLTKNAKTRMAIVPNGFVQSANAPDVSTWIQPVDLILGPTGVVVGIVEDTALVLNPGDAIVMYSDIGFVTGRVHGLVRTIGA